MALNRINPAQVAQQRGLERFQEAQRRDQARAQDRRPESAPGAGRPDQGDRVEISDNARRLMEIHQNMLAGQEALQKVPDVRDEKVDAARERLTRGYYHSVEVTSDVAEKVGRALDALDEL